MNHRTIKWQALCVILFFITACTKIESTQLGSDLIPVVDNVNTFETILPIVANNYIDETEYRLNASNPHMVGAISQDPVFGKSRATMFFEMKPTFPFVFAADTVQTFFDSAVLVLSYVGSYGDTLTPVNLNLYSVDRQMQEDTLLTPAYTLQPDLDVDRSKHWGSANVLPYRFKDSLMVITKDTTKVVNQLRIRLDDALAKQLFQADTNTVYKSDSAFVLSYPGFALEADQNSNTLLYFNLKSESKIEFYYRTKTSTTTDTTSSTFTVTSLCGHAVKFDNDRNGDEINNFLTPDLTNGNDKIFIQNSPGTYAKLHVLGTDTFNTVNRVIHRAEIRITQIEPLANPLLTPPVAMYLDIIDTTSSEVTYKGIPKDLSPFTGPYYCYPNAAGIDFSYFGGITNSENVNNVSTPVYRFNVSRYLQSVLANGEPMYDFRLSAPFYTTYKNCANNNGSYPQQVFPFMQNGSLLDVPGAGRIKVAGGGTNLPQNVRMQMRIVYSKL